jgi:hypothetical protein
MLKYFVLLFVLLCCGCYSNPVTLQEFRKLEKSRFSSQNYPLYNLGLKDGMIYIEAHGRIYQFKPEEVPFAQKYPYSKSSIELKQDLTDLLMPQFLNYWNLDPEKP